MRDFMINSTTFQLRNIPLCEVSVYACTLDAFDTESESSAGYFIGVDNVHESSILMGALRQRLSNSGDNRYFVWSMKDKDFQDIFSGKFIVWRR